nr:hypothetical protein [Tanacetum cinerariifolium]
MHDKAYVTQTDLNKQLLPEVADPNVEDSNVLPEFLPEDREDVLPEVSDLNVVMEEVTSVIISLEIAFDYAMEITYNMKFVPFIGIDNHEKCVTL